MLLMENEPVVLEGTQVGRATTHTLRLHSAAGRIDRRPVTPEAIDNVTPQSISATDPRWVLATRVRESMQGQMLPAERRDRLLKIGGLLGLTPFESNLVIAIVQDQVRRGGTIADAAPSLAMVPRHATTVAAARLKRVGMLVAAAIAAEIALIIWLFA